MPIATTLNAMIDVKGRKRKNLLIIRPYHSAILERAPKAYPVI